MISRFRRSFADTLGQVGVAFAVVLAAPAVSGQPTPGVRDWPKEPITFVAPFSPGGGGDTLTRLFADQFARALGATVVVENRPGAGGNIGTASVARAAPDGQTVVFGTMGTMGTNHALYKKPGYTIDDFEPVALFGSTALALVVGPGSSIRSVSDIVSQARQQPGKLSCASGGNGTVSHLACAMLQQMTGIDVNHVPYKASPAAYVDLMADRVSFMIDVVPPLAAQVKGGKLRAVAFVDTLRELAERSGAALDLRCDREGDAPLNLTAIVAELPEGAHVYACGPAGLLSAFEAATAALPRERVHLERFASSQEAATEGGFTVKLARDGRSVPIPAGRSILDALVEIGIHPPHACREGTCGTCETRVIDGTPDHRDQFLSDAEMAEGKRMMICCSGSKSPVLVLDL